MSPAVQYGPPGIAREAQEKVSPAFSKAAGFQRAGPFGRAFGAESSRAKGAVFLGLKAAPRTARNPRIYSAEKR